MKTIVLIAIFSTAVAAPLLADDTNTMIDTNTVTLTDKKAQVSYALGVMVGGAWRTHGVTNLVYKLVLLGLMDSEAGHPKLSQEQIRATLNEYSQELAKQQEAERQELAAKNLPMAKAFMAKNAKAKGIQTFPDGLQYKVLTEGTGESPTSKDIVTLSYEGTLADGTQFESRDETSFQMNRVIPGWREALEHMKVGSEWELFIPPDLAYGTNGRPPQIEPNSVLIFKLHLLSFEPSEPITSDIYKVPSAEEIQHGAKVEIIKPEDAQKMQQQPQGK